MKNYPVGLIKALIQIGPKIAGLTAHMQRMEAFAERSLALQARTLIDQNNLRPKISQLSDVEFQIYSQWGEDGILQYLIHHLGIEKKTFIEFGVEDYRESNTRFLLQHHNWRGIIFDACPKNIQRIKNAPFYWRNQLEAHQAFITKEGINQLIGGLIDDQDLGLLSIDIDGNDYWVWQEISVIMPRIIVCEFNALFGYEHQITIPYNAHFNRTKAHYSNLYFGASLQALISLGNSKGYTYLGCNQDSVNAFFVRNDLAPLIKPRIEKTPSHQLLLRQSRNRKGELNFLTPKQQLAEIAHLPIIDLQTSRQGAIGDILADQL